MRNHRRSALSSEHGYSSDWLNAQEGRGPFGAHVSARTLAATPSAPTNLAVAGVNRTSVTVRWQPPATDGGAHVHEYQAELRPKSLTSLNGTPDDWLMIYTVRCAAAWLSQCNWHSASH